MRYTVKAAARATGVSESRLRTWERRYGIPSPNRSETGRRLYEDADLVVIRRMAALVVAGVSASEAAHSVLAEEPAPEVPASPVEAHPSSEAILAAALAYDEAAIIRQVREAIEELGWAEAMSVAVFPALRKVGEFWGDNRVPSANEHFLTELTRRELSHALASEGPAVFDAPLLLLACPQDERHDIGLLALCLLLRQAGLRVCYLGGDVPQFDLMLAIQQVRPDAICLGVTLASSRASLLRAAREVVSSRMQVRVFLGGPGLRQSSSSAEQALGIRLPDRLGDAADVIVKSLKEARR